MKVAILDENLLWSVRLSKGIQNLGHQAEVISSPDQPHNNPDVALVNIDGAPWTLELAQDLLKINTPVIGHAGHKEKHLWEKGKQLGLTQVISHSMMANKLDKILEDARKNTSNPPNTKQS